MKRKESEEMQSTGRSEYDRYASALWNKEPLEDNPYKGYRVVHVELVDYEPPGRGFVEFSLMKDGNGISVRVEVELPK